MGYGRQENWTRDEVEALRAKYPRHGLERTARELRRGAGSVTYMVRRLHLRFRVQEPWTAEQDAIIRAHYPTKGAAGVLARVNSAGPARSRKAVIGRAWRLGVEYRKFRTRKPCTDGDVREMHAT